MSHTFKTSICLFTMAALSMANAPLPATAQTVDYRSDAQRRVPTYSIPYQIPTEKSIIEVLQAVKGYYERSAERTIINAKTGEVIADTTVMCPDAMVNKGFATEWTYTHGVVLSAFDYIDNILDDKSYFANNAAFYDYVSKWQPYFAKQNITGWRPITNMSALDHCGSIGAAMVKTYLKTKNKAYLPLIERVDKHVSHDQCRLSDGTLSRHRPQWESVWADDMYMSVPFLINMYVMTGKKAYADDAVRQILQMSNRLFVPQEGIFDHGWNANSSEYDPHFYWGRANGWVLMSMAEVLDRLPKNYKGRNEILHLYRTMVQKLANLQDGNGFWHNLLDKNDTFEETSCTAMFTYAIAKGINEGWISHVYGPVAVTGWNATRSAVRADGAVDWTAEGTTFAHDNSYYYHRGHTVYATHGYGVVLYAGAEMIRLLRNPEIEIVAPKDGAVNSTIHFLKRSEWPDRTSVEDVRTLGGSVDSKK